MIYIVTPVHNRKEVTRSFLTCLQEQTFKEFITIIIDDGSTDGTSEMIQSEFGDTIVLKGDGQLWWSGGTNMGLRHVLGVAKDEDYVLIINDDVGISRDYLERIHAFAVDHPSALVGSVMVDADEPDRILDGGRLRNWWTAKCRVLHKGSLLSSFPEDAFFEVSQLTGRGMLAPVRVFREIGLYDAEHFRHRGDTELPVRASKHGYRLLVFYGACVEVFREMTYETETGTYKLRDIRKYFFDFRSSGCISFRWHFAASATTSFAQFCCYFLFDLVRVIGHFFRRLEYPPFVSGFRGIPNEA